MKSFVRKGAAVSFGVVSLFALIVGSMLLLAAFGGGFYYHETHTKMIDCAEFVRNHLEKDLRYPTTDMMENWSRQNNVSPSFVLGAPGRHDSFSILDGKPHNSETREFRIAHWDGERFEFFNSWDGSFTTSIRQHSGQAALFGIVSLAIGFASFRIRGHFKKARVEQGEDTKVSPAIS